jgi:MtfA peptidase
MAVFVFLSVIVIFAAIIFRIIYFFYSSFSNTSSHKPFTFAKARLSSKFKIPIINHFTYYHTLSDKQKIEFERRVNNFLHNKQFIPMHGLKLTAEMVALISASAIQLTLGLPEVYFVHFDKIFVFPAEFFNSITRAKHKGEVNEMGTIAFSWKDFSEGYINHDDTYNVGLHEMAHALSLENGIKNQEYDFLDKEKLRRWKILADAEYERINMGYATFLRKYAASSRSEFFPVAIEHFFERPDEFKKEAPHLYAALSDLLNQDLAKAVMEQ